MITIDFPTMRVSITTYFSKHSFFSLYLRPFILPSYLHDARIKMTTAVITAFLILC